VVSAEFEAAQGAGRERAGHIEVEALRLGAAPVTIGTLRAVGSPRRVFATAVDTWLRAGGWARGQGGAGSVLVRGPRARLTEIWDDEVRARGWDPATIHTMVVVSHEGARLYWWRDGPDVADPPLPAPCR
jgi:hypothetical protein